MMIAQEWLKAFLTAFEEVPKKEFESDEAKQANWTEFLGDVVEKVFSDFDKECKIIRKRVKKINGNDSREYLTIDVVFTDDNTYALPKAVVELENDPDLEKIKYCLWKILCVRSLFRVLICYQKNDEKVAALRKQIEDVVIQDKLMDGEQGSLLILIGNEGAEWKNFFSAWEWRFNGLKELQA